jgi:hypothetical protein
MNPQQMADFIARLAKPRLMELLKLQTVEFLYDATPGRPPATYFYQGREIPLKLQKTSQPYKDIYRFANAEKVQQFILDPGLVPLVKAIKTDVRGQKFLMTRKVERKDEREKGPVGHLDGFGMRILLQLDLKTEEWQVIWECLYGVA